MTVEELDELEELAPAVEPFAIGPGAESVRVELWAAAPGAARWDHALWDGAQWAAPTWQGVGCDIAEATYRYGAAGESGILSLATAGELDLETIDPDRSLDPLNASSPWYGYVKPGSPIRIVGLVPGSAPAFTGFLDEAEYDMASERGRLRAVDGIAYLAQAQVPDGATLPNTLRARVREIVRLAGLSAIVPVEPEPATTVQLVVNGTADPPTTAGWTGRNGGAIGVEGYSPAGGGGTSPNGSANLLTVLNPTAGASYPGATSDIRPVVPGAVYTLSTWHRGVGTQRQRSCRAEFLRADGSVTEGGLGVQEIVLSPAQGDGVWRHASRSVTAPADAEKVLVWPFIYEAPVPANESWAQFDDISLTGPNPDATVDPPVAPHDGVAASAWDLIARAQTDALTYVWLGPDGMLRFRSWGGFPDAPFAGIGCAPGDALPADEWLEGLSTIASHASADAIRNSVRAYSSGTTWAASIQDAASVARYGPRPFDIDRVVPDRTTWAGRILADRADAGLEVRVGELRPYTQAELAALLDAAQLGACVVRVRDDSHTPLVDLDLSWIGATVGISAMGWRWRLVTALSRVEWDSVSPTPPDPIPPNPSRPYHTETRVYACTRDTLLALTSGGSKYGAGASSTLPVGVWQGWTYRAVLGFATVPFGTPGAAGEIRAVKAARLNVRSSTQVRVGFGSSPKVKARRITASWSEGSSSSPGSGNATVWPGPSTTSSGETTGTLPTGQNVEKDLTVTEIVRAWAPAAIGGSGAAQHGIALYEYGSSTANTGEVWPRENGTAGARPELSIDVEVYDSA